MRTHLLAISLIFAAALTPSIGMAEVLVLSRHAEGQANRGGQRSHVPIGHGEPLMLEVIGPARLTVSLRRVFLADEQAPASSTLVAIGHGARRERFELTDPRPAGVESRSTVATLDHVIALGEESAVITVEVVSAGRGVDAAWRLVPAVEARIDEPDPLPLAELSSAQDGHDEELPLADLMFLPDDALAGFAEPGDEEGDTMRVDDAGADATRDSDIDGAVSLVEAEPLDESEDHPLPLADLFEAKPTETVAMDDPEDPPSSPVDLHEPKPAEMNEGTAASELAARFVPFEETMNARSGAGEAGDETGSEASPERGARPLFGTPLRGDFAQDLPTAAVALRLLAAGTGMGGGTVGGGAEVLVDSTLLDGDLMVGLAVDVLSYRLRVHHYTPAGTPEESLLRLGAIPVLITASYALPVSTGPLRWNVSAGAGPLFATVRDDGRVKSSSILLGGAIGAGPSMRIGPGSISATVRATGGHGSAGDAEGVTVNGAFGGVGLAFGYIVSL